MKFSFYAAALFGVASLLSHNHSHAQQAAQRMGRQSLNEWHWQNDDFYRALDQSMPLTSAVKKTAAAPELYRFNCQDLWLSGTNLAWRNFGRDVGDGNVDIAYFEDMFEDVANAGGNSVRWWLHTNVSFTPIFDANGYCTGLGDNVISEMEKVLDAAQDHGIALDICLFSFDMLQDQWEMDASINQKWLTSTTNIQSYIDNALTPMVTALKDHPALLCWEIFNEPEGMTNEFGWTPTKVDMFDVQRVVNMLTGAIHRMDPANPVTNGSWSFRALSDVVNGTNEMNYYRDDRLIAAGGDADGTLDFYQVHYYDWAGTALSPFHHDADYWDLDKPLMVAEFHVEETYGVAEEDLLEELYNRGYFGGWGWQYNEQDLWAEIEPALTAHQLAHPNNLAIDYNNGCSKFGSKLQGPPFARKGGDQGLAACHDKFVGNIMPSSWAGPIIRDDWGDYWNQITPENAGKWGVVEGSRDQYNWNDLDVMYDYAQANGLPFKHHVFVWGSQQPDWMEGLSQSEQLEELEEWYSLFAARYPNVEMIDVVNESIRNHSPDLHFVDAIGGFNNGANNAFLAANVDKYGPYNTGWDYIIWAFAKAREYFPHAELHLNDYGIINDPTAITEHLAIVNILKERGLIDAVGIQCHQFNVDNLSATNIQNNLDQLATAGLPIYVAELDITGQNEQQQADRYAEKFPVFFEHPSVAGITLWGYVEGTTWIDGTGLLNPDGSERLAMTWLKSYLDCGNINELPSISISSPSDMTAFVEDEAVTFEVNASDADGSVVEVKYYDGNQYIGNSTAEPFTFEVSDLSIGTHDIIAVAIDDDGGQTSSDPVSVVIEVFCPTIEADNDTLCHSGIANLTATGGSGTFNWFISTEGEQPIFSGIVYEPEVDETTTYYVQDASLSGVSQDAVGETEQNGDALIWNIDDFETADKQILFTVSETVTLQSIDVIPENANTNVVLNITEQGAGSPLHTATFDNAPASQTTVEFDVELAPGTYVLDAIGTNKRLEYQSDLGTFPYELEGYFSFTGNASWVISDGRYGMFYNWQLSYETTTTCPRTSVQVIVDDELCDVVTKVETIDPLQLNAFPNPSSGQISLKASRSAQVWITNIAGQIVQQIHLVADRVVSISLAPGVYQMVEPETGENSRLVVTSH